MKKIKGRIFAVDDDELIVSMLARSLKNEAYEVNFQTTTTDVVANIAAWHPDLVFLDIDIDEEMNGLDILAAIKKEGIATEVVMLTGDNRTTALAVAKRLGLAEVEAEVLPDQKSAVIEKLTREGRVVAMAGDGVNDAPALAAAQVGIAMGTGADVAIESAGITLLKGDLTGILKARALSAAVMRNIRQNLFFAFIYNTAGVPIAAGVLYPAFGLLLSPIIAAAAMALSSVSVVGNALRLRRVGL